MTETTQSERERLLDMPVDNIVHSLCRDADRLARLEYGIRAMADVTDFGDDNEEVVRCNWVRDRLIALLDE